MLTGVDRLPRIIGGAFLIKILRLITDKNFWEALVMSRIKEFIRDVSPFNNRTEMPVLLYVIKVIIIFWFVKFVSELICEGAVIGLHFACGKNPLQGEVFDGNVIILITYFGYALMVGIFFLYWKLFQKKTIAELGFTKNCGTYLWGMIIGAILVVVSVFSITAYRRPKGTFGQPNTVMLYIQSPQL